MIREACVEGFGEALKAQELGANRIELCENLAVGGTTPSLGTLICCKKYLNIPVIAMIRPRGGDFVYNQYELEAMAEDIKAFHSAGADGIAIGLLNRKGEVDMPNLQLLLKHAGNMQVTFHKAIDVTNNIQNEFLRLCNSGQIFRVLTSGGAATALEGASVLKSLIEISKGKTIILAAGKITRDNLNYMSTLIPTSEFHGKKIVGDLNVNSGIS